MNTVELYDAYVSAYIKREGSEDVSPHEAFVIELHNLGVDVSANEAKTIAYDIAYFGSYEMVEELNDGR